MSVQPGDKITATITGRVLTVQERGIYEVETGAPIPYVIDPHEPGVTVVKDSSEVNVPMFFMPGDLVRHRRHGVHYALGEDGYLIVGLRDHIQGHALHPYGDKGIESFGAWDFDLIELSKMHQAPF